jgi:adducin
VDSVHALLLSIVQGECVEEGTTNFGVNKAGFMLHSAIHAARPDIKCVVHLHTPNIVAVSTGYSYLCI